MPADVAGCCAGDEEGHGWAKVSSCQDGKSMTSIIILEHLPKVLSTFIGSDRNPDKLFIQVISFLNALNKDQGQVTFWNLFVNWFQKLID